MMQELPRDPSVELNEKENVESIIADIHRISYGKIHCTQNELDALIKRIKQSELRSEFLLYEKKIHPTLALLEHSVDIITTTLTQEKETSTDPEEVGELKRSIDFFSHRIKEIKSAITRYCEAIAQFEIQNKLRIKYPERADLRTKFEQIDRNRRLMHDNLFMVLSTFSKKIRALKEEGYIDQKQIYFWNAEKMASATADKPQYDDDGKTIHAFHDSILDSKQERNRKLIQQWAIAADLFENIKRIIHIFKMQQEE